ncbi:MAG: AAA domain-containing protein, partial [Pseudomonadota bacterium]
MTGDKESLQLVRDRLTRIFRYLQALNQHRNPAKRLVREQEWVLWFRDLPEHPAIRVAYPVGTGAPEAPADSDVTASQAAETQPILAVARPTLAHPPEPPAVMAGWLEPGWEEPDGAIVVTQSRFLTGPDGKAHGVKFGEDPDRLEQFEDWRVRWEEWRDNERRARQAMRLFERLYELRSRLEREGERLELMLGDGLLSWHRSEGDINHPLLLQRVQLEFDSTRPEFTLLFSDSPPELYSAIFQSVEDVNAHALAACRKEMDEHAYTPLGDEDTNDFLQRFAVGLSSRGQFTGEGEPKAEEFPQIGHCPVLFLRKRTLGFATAIEGILEDIQNRSDFPESLLGVAGLLSPVSGDGSETPEEGSDPETILFGKPANREQVRIAQLFGRHGCVLVQGPPGTGKTHTIGNLIGHFLAQGKSVLVTAHTTKALRVLRRQVVKALQPLCVSLLDRDIESREQLKAAVEGIAERLASAEAGRLETEAQDLANTRHRCLERLSEVRQKIIEARGGEYRDIVVGGQGFQPSRAARKVASETAVHGWVPSPVIPGAPLPLSETEFTDLYHTNLTVSPEAENELSSISLTPSDIITPDDFENLVNERERLLATDPHLKSELWARSHVPEEAGRIHSLAERVRLAAQAAGEDEWKLAAIDAGRLAGDHEKNWRHLLSLIDDVRQLAAGVQGHLLNHSPVPAESFPLEEQDGIVADILRHLEAGGKLGTFTLLTRSTWRQVIREARCNGREPRSTEHFQAISACIQLTLRRTRLATWWDGLMTNTGVSATLDTEDRLEQVCAQFAEPISLCLCWHTDTWVPIENELKEMGLQWDGFLGEQPPSLAAYGELVRLLDALAPLQNLLEARVNALEIAVVEERLGDLRRTLDLAAAGNQVAETVQALRKAAEQADPAAYRQAFSRFVELHSRLSELSRRRQLLARLEASAPAWASLIRERVGQHGLGQPPGDVRAAWLWRQLHDELDRRNNLSLKDLQAEWRSLRRQLRDITVDLIDRRAWAAQVKRTSRAERQALFGWLQIVRRIGKGTGIKATRLMGEARRYMADCREAVPVWIMPLARAVENYDPRKARFDVVIIDEASQLDSMGLLPFYLGRQVLVVGDPEQVSPLAVGEKDAVVRHLIDEHLEGIPNNSLYDGQQSIYHLAQQSFDVPVMLREHFRCVPDIIGFSNQLSYQGRIQPLRDASQVKLKPHVIAHRVWGGSAYNKINRREV